MNWWDVDEFEELSEPEFPHLSGSIKNSLGHTHLGFKGDVINPNLIPCLCIALAL